MARKYYCAKCGKELTLIRKPAKGTVLNLIEPHECEGYAIKESDKPTVLEIIEKLGHYNPAAINEDSKSTSKGWLTGGDKRKDVISTAPSSIIDAVKGGLYEEG